MNLLSIGAAISALYFGVKAGKTANAADKITFDVSRVKWRGWSSGGVKIDTYFKLTNPTKTVVTVNYLFLDISLPDGPKITSISKSAWNQVIQKETTSEILVPVKIMLSDLLKVGLTLLRSFQSGKMPKSIQVNGNVKANNIPISFDEVVEI